MNSSPGEAMDSGPLVGIRVIEVGNVIAAPFATALLGDLGAEVIKVELPGVGDTLRKFAPVHRDTSLLFAAQARNKKSITLDMRKAKGRELLKRLVTMSDVLAENFLPGTLENWGLGYEELSRINPRLVMLRISGYGQAGPMSRTPGFGTSCQAFGGLTYISGYPDRPPINQPFSMADYVAGIFGALGVVSALYYRDTKSSLPQGQVVELGLYEAVFRLLEFLPAEYSVTGTVRERIGNASHSAAPVGIFQTSDGRWVSLAISTDPVFNRLAQAMGMPEILNDPHFDTNPHRAEHARETNDLVGNWIASHSIDELRAILDRYEVPFSPVYSIADIFQDPQYAARDNIVEVIHPTLGSMRIPNAIPNFSLTRPSVRSPAPLLGQHNQEVYCGLLGLREEELDESETDGVI